MNVPAYTPTQTRQRAFRFFGIAVAIVAAGWFLYWFVALRHFERTDDAYVATDVIAVTSEVSGTVKAVHVADTVRVHRGDVLVELDDTDARLALAGAEAELERTVRDVYSRLAQQDQWRAAMRARQVALTRARSDLARREGLDRDGVIAAEEVAHARDTVAEQEAAVASAEAQVSVLSAELQGTSVATHPRVVAAAMAVRNAALALARTQIRAPIDGVIARKSVQAGQRIAAGAPLMALADLDHVWIDANFKEVQLGHLVVGLPATIRTDIYGSDVELKGRVVGVSAGSGAAFALLPAQNASGNWIKIVQRVPVRIAVDPADLSAHPLRVGLSTSVAVDIAGAVDAHVAVPHERSVAPVTVDTATEERIEDIIRRAHPGHSRHHAHSGSAVTPP